MMNVGASFNLIIWYAVIVLILVAFILLQRFLTRKHPILGFILPAITLIHSIFEVSNISKENLLPAPIQFILFNIITIILLWMCFKQFKRISVLH
jgi:hypothetical protein